MEWLKTTGKTALKIFIWIGIAVAAALTAYGVYRYYLARIGVVTRPKKFRRIPGQPSRILVKTDNEWVQVELPDGVDSKDVAAAGFGESIGGYKVEIKHKVIDRRDSSPIADSAASRLRTSHG